MIEMLLQSHDGVVYVLPALPDQWANGHIQGVKARGGFELDITWKNGKIDRLTVRSPLGGNCRLRVHRELAVSGNKTLATASGTNPNPFYQLPENQNQTAATAINGVFTYDVATEAGKAYTFTGK